MAGKMSEAEILGQDWLTILLQILSRISRYKIEEPNQMWQQYSMLQTSVVTDYIYITILKYKLMPRLWNRKIVENNKTFLVDVWKFLMYSNLFMFSLYLYNVEPDVSYSLLILRFLDDQNDALWYAYKTFVGRCNFYLLCST